MILIKKELEDSYLTINKSFKIVTTTYNFTIKMKPNS